MFKTYLLRTTTGTLLAFIVFMMIFAFSSNSSLSMSASEFRDLALYVAVASLITGMFLSALETFFGGNL